ncbi:hypothetical protein PGB90_006464 [Kerria lacca]
MCDSSNSHDYVFNATSSLISSSTGVFPSVTDFAGDLNFEIILNAVDSAKKKWLYSEKLKKVFIDINKNIGVRFKWHDLKSENPCPRFIRALPVYTQDDWLRIPVERCPMHRCYEENLNIDFPWVNHVLRCENEGTQYEIDVESHRGSCITPVALKDRDDTAILYYKFVCKTSCYRGMQRRPVVVIFTLEDVLGNVLGRRCLSFKVCSCLKRDLHREESGLRKRKSRKLSIPISIVDYDTKPSMNISNLPSLPNTINMNSNETIRPYYLQLLRLKREYVIFAMKIMHNALLGQFMRENIDGTEILISQIERYLNGFLLTYPQNKT